MVNEIREMKDTLLKQAKKELQERGPERIDVNRMGEIIDMVKDLAEAEKACWEASYYSNAVGESMEKKYGYSSGGQQGGQMGGQNSGGRPGYGGQSMGFHDEMEYPMDARQMNVRRW